MKKLSYLFAILGLFAFTACGGGSNEEATSEEAVTEEAVIEEATEAVEDDSAHDHGDGEDHDHDHEDGEDHGHEH
tara:strand:- start:2154 stop:2378 length:225 start_codon:yes stop_codon:yes gene_type:complete